MPIYLHKCDLCRAKGKEVMYPMSAVGQEDQIDTDIKKQISCIPENCKYKSKQCQQPGVLWPRIPFATHIANQKGGTTVTERDLLKDKQKQRKLRSRLHFKNDIYKTLSKQDKRMMKGKHDHLKGDHEKMK